MSDEPVASPAPAAAPAPAGRPRPVQLSAERIGDRDRLREWLRLHLIAELGAVSIRRLVGHFGTPGAVLTAGERELREVAGLGAKRAASVMRNRDRVDPDAEIAKAAAIGAVVICIDSPGYPALLRSLHDPPACLTVWGDPGGDDALGVGIVGSRAATGYGLATARTLSAGLARAGLVIVSGLALGIDGAAHTAAVEAGGRTIAVLGGGLGKLYPKKHEDLAARIAAGAGAVISEFPVDTPPSPERFPQRNRIISGLSAGIIVVEAPQRSGSLITARLAVEQGRDVFAVPGRIDQPEAKGCHWLIKNGARLVDSPEDVLFGLGLVRTAVNAAEPDPPREGFRPPGRGAPPVLASAWRSTAALTAEGSDDGEPPDEPDPDLVPARPRAVQASLFPVAPPASGEQPPSRPPATTDPSSAPQPAPAVPSPAAKASPLPAPAPGNAAVETRRRQFRAGLSDVERAVLAALEAGPADRDEIIVRSGRTAVEVNGTLTKLELKGLVSARHGGVFEAR